ncbi:sigma-70 family RNA polymerase sigma factor [Tabrizicola sp.]|uniref:sigma-70 family RNA polymerase sigma factor n=1 Tax=Tabrizicola sp. TaxID=2005166 RepID=UPI00286B808F|nr:sigma-70 family RNA polymerase sigma factor [Tabrizicola sp.]
MQHGSDDEDAALISAVANGRESALAQLIARHGRGLAAIATRYLSNPAEAEDVVQEVFVRVWSHAARFDPTRARATTWLYAIAVRLCIDRLRKLRLRRFFGLGAGIDSLDDISDTAPATDSALASRQELALTRTAIAALPDRQRMAILLSAVAGLETSRIAETLDISVGAVEQLLVRARRTLRSSTGRDT